MYQEHRFLGGDINEDQMRKATKENDKNIKKEKDKRHTRQEGRIKKSIKVNNKKTREVYIERVGMGHGTKKR